MIKEYSDLRITGIQCAKASAGSGMDCSDLSVVAAQKLMKRLQVLPEEIGTMVYVTQSPRFMTPSTSFYIHNELKMGIDCFQYDTNQGAAGCLTGIQLVSSLMLGFQEKKKGLLLLGDNGLATGEKLLNQAAAVLIEERSGECIYIGNYSDGTAYRAYFQGTRQGEPVVSEKFLDVGTERLQEEIGKMERFAEEQHMQIGHRLEYRFEYDSAVRLPFCLTERKAEGNVMVGIMGAGLSVATAILKLEEAIYDVIID